MRASTDDDITTAAKARVGRTLRQKWRLDKLLGVGGMAAVYAATHRNENRAAVKVLHDELSSIDDVKKRFMREAYVANKVAHPGTVRVIDDDTDVDGTVFLVMDLLDGETLSQRLERRGKRLFAAEVCKMADEILDVLAAAHDKAVVHRDVKPENVFLTTAGRTKLLDFGFARVLDAAQQASSITGMRTTIGTPAFMPPEQAAGRWSDVDARSDLWALGATMFFALSGEYVHEGETVADVLVAAATQPARSLQSVAPHLPHAIVAVVQRALAFESPMRWPDARAMQKAVRDALKGAPSAATKEEEAPSSERTIVVTDEPTLKRPPIAPRPAPTAPRPMPPSPSRDDEDTVSETMLAVMVDTSGAPMPGVSRLSDPGPLSSPLPPASIPAPTGARVVVETTPYSGADAVEEVVAEIVADSSPSPPDPPLPRGFRPPGPSSPFWEQSASGVNAAPDVPDLPPPRSQQATMPAIGERAVDRAPSSRPTIVVAGAVGFLFVLFAAMIAFLFLR